jgi:hypothetical protein
VTPEEGEATTPAELIADEPIPTVVAVAFIVVPVDEAKVPPVTVIDEYWLA